MRATAPTVLGVAGTFTVKSFDQEVIARAVNAR
jgi:hypothetical protein